MASTICSYLVAGKPEPCSLITLGRVRISYNLFCFTRAWTNSSCAKRYPRVLIWYPEHTGTHSSGCSPSVTLLSSLVALSLSTFISGCSLSVLSSLVALPQYFHLWLLSLSTFISGCSLSQYFHLWLLSLSTFISGCSLPVLSSLVALSQYFHLWLLSLSTFISGCSPSVLSSLVALRQYFHVWLLSVSTFMSGCSPSVLSESALALPRFAHTITKM